MWAIEVTGEYLRREKWFEKNRPGELNAVLHNLKQYHVTLQEGVKPQQIQGQWVHPEPMGVYALGEKGGGQSRPQRLKPTRLYVLSGSCVPDSAQDHPGR